MKHVSILIPRGHTSLVNIEGTYQILNNVNEILTELDKPPIFNIHLVGLAKEIQQTTGLFTINTDVLIDEVKQTDLIIIPAIHGDPLAAKENNKDFIPWLVHHYNNGTEVASFCIGSFFLASTGLLKGIRATTHWRYAEKFRNMFPDVNLLDDKIMTEDKRIYTSGGAYSYLNLLLYLIEKYAGREVAVLISKTFMIDINRNSQSPFIMFKGQKDHGDELVIKAQEYIENNFSSKITVEELAVIFALSKRNFERRFKKATANTVAEYIQRVKVEAAKMNLEFGGKNVNEVMYNVGYSDSKAFRNLFKKITGITPIAYRNKYYRNNLHS